MLQQLLLRPLRQHVRALAMRAGIGNGAGAPPRKTPGKLSNEMRGRYESALTSIRAPKPPKRERTHRPTSWRVLRGDLVQLIGGPPQDIGRRGRVLEVVRRSNRVVVEGVNIVKKFVPADGGQQDDDKSSRKRVLQTESPVHRSNVAVVCPQTGLPTRVGIQWLEDGTRVRVSRRSGGIIPRPEMLRERRMPVESGGATRATGREEALRQTRDRETELSAL